ncbi:MAG TPA: alpha/beta hydrolase [Thermoanaerobaculia bacterium]|nr:alpha/beta hydrolase [Thermoanaerobaculia bacterium]
MLLRFYLGLMGWLMGLAGARRCRATVEDGVEVVYWRMGKGREPWLLLHGLGSVAASWGWVLRALSRDCRLVVPELSSLGGTRAPEGGLTVAQGARMAARLIEQEVGGGPATVAGLSLGGWMAVRLALARPELVERLVLVDAAGYRDQDWERISELIAIDDLAGVERIYAAMFHRVPWMMRFSRGSFLRAYTSPGVRNILRNTAEQDTYSDHDLARLPMPVALIWGERDGVFGLQTARRMAAALPESRLEVLPDCSHAVHLECPRRLAKAIERFRRATPLAARATSGLPKPAAIPARPAGPASPAPAIPAARQPR